MLRAFVLCSDNDLLMISGQVGGSSAMWLDHAAVTCPHAAALSGGNHGGMQQYP